MWQQGAFQSDGFQIGSAAVGKVNYTLSGAAGSYVYTGIAATFGYISNAPAPASGGGGSTSRVDFDLRGRSRRFDEEPKRAIEKKAKETANAVIAKAQEIAKQRAVLNAIKETQQRERVSQARLAKAAALEAKVAAMEADLEILRDDEEVLQIFMQVIA